MQKVSTIGITAITFLWAGMVCGISFLEAPLKFQAPGITIELGLGIGRLVFGALTKIEMAFSLFLIAFLSLSESKFKTWMLFMIPILIVIIDNAVLMPIMNERVEMIVNGVTPEPSSTHLWYIMLELLKLGSLLFGGIVFVKRRLKLS